MYPFFKGSLSNVFRGVGASLVLVLYDEVKTGMAKAAGTHWFFCYFYNIYFLKLKKFFHK